MIGGWISEIWLMRRKIVIWRAGPAANDAPGWCAVRDSWAAPGNDFAQENHCPASVGRGLDPADPVSVLDWYVEWYHFQNNYGVMPPKPIFDSIFPTWQVSLPGRRGQKAPYEWCATQITIFPIICLQFITLPRQSQPPCIFPPNQQNPLRFSRRG